jgi:tetratricopeptide (TPR) repeat protein
MKLWVRLIFVYGIACLALVLGGCATQNPKTMTRADMQRRLGDIKLSKGQYELAIREYRHSLQLYARDPDTYFGLAEAYRRKGLLDEAEATLLEALRLDPAHQEARLNLGVVLLQKERWGDAIVQNRILLDDPTFLRPSRALVNIGWAYYKSGDLQRAKSSFVEALSGDSTNLEAHLDLGIVLYQLGEVVEAIRYFQRAVEIAEKRPVPASAGIAAESRFRMAQAHVKLGQLERAIEHLRVAAESGGNGEWGRKSKEYLQVLE